MAKLETPFLSFRARGQLAKTFVAYVWHGINCLRAYVVPHDPKTALQLIQRNNFRLAVAAWRYYLTDPTVRGAWALEADKDPRPIVYYHAAYSNLTKQFQLHASPSFATAITTTDQQRVRFIMSNMDDGAQGDEAGDFDIYAGIGTETLSYVESKPINVNGVVRTSTLGPFGCNCFCQIVKGTKRSGVYSTLLDVVP